MRGLLAIWSDIAPELETDYLHWLTREHTSERVSTDGFRAVRVFRSTMTAACRYFILYELDGPGVLDSAAYVAKLNDPTPWTRRIMARVTNFARGGGAVIAADGVGQGGIVAPIATDTIPDREIVARLTGDRIAAVRLLATDQARTAVRTQEKSLRRDDRSFAGLILIEGLDESAVARTVERLALVAPHLSAAAGAPLYRQVFGLEKRMIV